MQQHMLKNIFLPVKEKIVIVPLDLELHLNLRLKIGLHVFCFNLHLKFSVISEKDVFHSVS